jgi:ABC-type uncharacterized transport system permease subunit
MTRSVDRPPRTYFFNRELLATLTRYLAMILMAFVLFGIILWLSGRNPLQSYQQIFHSALGSAYGFSEVLVAMTPMLITAVAVALPSRVGLINVGVEGQLYMGALFATWGALTFSGLPAWILLPGMVGLGVLGGALWAFIPGYLKAIGLVNETITSLLLNSVAPSIVSFFIFGFWHAPRDTNITANFVPAARLPTFFGTRVDLGFLFALALLAALWLFTKYTRWGLEMRAIGGNPPAARRNGIPVPLYLVVVMAAGGGIAGLAGTAQVSGYYGLLLANFSNGLGFMGFLISWLAAGDPLGIFLIASVVAVITTGGNLLQLTQGLPYAVINILLAFTLFIVLARPTFLSREKRS